MGSSSFDFLKDEFPELHEPITKAELYVYVDSVTSLMRARQFVELLALKSAGEVPTAEEVTFGRVLGALAQEFPHFGDIKDAIYKVWMVGNNAVHRNRGDSLAGLDALRRCHTAAKWFMKEFGSDKVQRWGTYVAPQPPSGWSSPRAERPKGAWIIRPYPHYKDRRKEFIRNGIIAIGWWPLGNIASASRDIVRASLEKHYRERRHRWTRDLNTIVTFRDEVAKGDLIVMAPLLMHDKQVAIGRVTTGQYEFIKARASEKEGWAHQKRVSWFPEMVSRYELPDSVRATFVRDTLVSTDAAALFDFCRKRGWQ